MKKIISILMVIVMLAISCISTAMASFSVSEMEMNMQHENMVSSECYNEMSSDCNSNIHECCYSPFKDSNTSSNASHNKEDKEVKGKITNVYFLALLQEGLEYNYIEKLTSPPDLDNSDTEENLYVALTGIIKNNC